MEKQNLRIILGLSIALIVIGTIGVFASNSIEEYLHRGETDDDDPITTTIIVTPGITTTQVVTLPPTTTPYTPTTTYTPPTTTPPRTTTTPITTTALGWRLGQFVVEGQYGLFNAALQPVDTNPLSLVADNKAVVWYMAQANYFELVAGYGLQQNFVFYLRSHVENVATGKIISLGTVQRDHTAFQMQTLAGHYTTRHLGRIDLNDKWVAVSNAPLQYKIDLFAMYRKLGISLTDTWLQKNQLKFHHEVIFDIFGTDGILHHKVKKSTMLVELTYMKDSGVPGILSMTGSGEGILGIPPLFILVAAVVIGGVTWKKLKR